MNIPKIRELKSKARVLKATVQIGKSGITETLIKEIKEQLRKKKLVKIKHALKGDNKTIANQLAEKTNSNMVLQIGKTVVLYKE